MLRSNGPNDRLNGIVRLNSILSVIHKAHLLSLHSVDSFGPYIIEGQFIRHRASTEIFVTQLLIFTLCRRTHEAEPVDSYLRDPMRPDLWQSEESDDKLS